MRSSTASSSSREELHRCRSITTITRSLRLSEKKSNPLHSGTTLGTAQDHRLRQEEAGGGVLDIHARMWPWWYEHMVW